eukprot:SAG31_NODE_1391_length_8535_cov_11.998696_4_plen_93_part_00
MILFLDDVDKEDGCFLHYLRGVGRGRPRQAINVVPLSKESMTQEDRHCTIPMVAKRGDALVYHTRVAQYADGNATARNRDRRTICFGHQPVT